MILQQLVVVMLISNLTKISHLSKYNLRHYPEISDINDLKDIFIVINQVLINIKITWCG